MVIRMPVAYCMLCSSIIYSMVYGESLNMIVSRAVQGSSGFTLLALSFFILAGNIMNRGGVTDRIFNFCKKTIGCSKKASESFFIKPKIIYYKLSVSIISFPDQRNA